MDALTLIVLFACHWAADYTHLSRPWMLAAKRTGKPLAPIAAHAAVHAVLMGLAMLAMHGATASLVTFAIQLPTHTAIDVLKGRCNAWIPSLQSPANVWHWWVFGADQYAHQLVIILTACLI